ncbi:hypothetical protein CASFOL_017804 [Castilleja foliolosa]|uniref:25S rRNA (uridine-N(3))-methyltransferase BMT5-like domain-containing protein n=1 Tax=Castilleja foliolosa TaxID=1961234 RepID=A0ABD3D8J6_9LAMI
MGNHHSNSKFLGCHNKEENGDSDRPNNFFDRLSKIFSFLHSSFINEAIKGLFQKARSIFCRPRPTKTSSTHSVSESLLHEDWSQDLQCHEINIDDAIVVSGKSPPDATQKACTSSNTIIGPKNANLGEAIGKVNKVSVVVDKGIWIKHYSSRHRILLVGEGDFSFSASLARAFGHASNMIATSLDSKTFLKKNYPHAWPNIVELTDRGCVVMHWVDATKMAKDEYLRGFKFDRIIFNFPFAGFLKDLSRESQLGHHRKLVRLFMKDAKGMLSENGEIHITHKTNGFNLEWDLESLAASQRLRLIEAVDFKHHHYPGYNNKRGFGGDESFNCDPSKTYKFGRAMP